MLISTGLEKTLSTVFGGPDAAYMAYSFDPKLQSAVKTTGTLASSAFSAALTGIDIYVNAKNGNPSGVVYATVKGDALIALSAITGNPWLPLLYEGANLTGQGVAFLVDWLVYQPRRTEQVQRFSEAMRKMHMDKVCKIDADPNDPDNPDDGSGEGSIMNQSDWVKIASSQGGKSAT